MTNPERTRVVFLDVDGTIVEDGRYIPASTIEAIRNARENGHLVFLCTGRSAVDLDRVLLDIGFDGAITNGGGHATFGEEVVVTRLLSAEAVAHLQERFEAHGVHWFLQGHDAMYISPGVAPFWDERRTKLSEQRRSGPREGWVELVGEGIAPLREIASADPNTISKTVILSDDASAVDRVLEELEGKFMHVTGTMPMPFGKSAEIAMLGMNKGATIVELLDHLGFDVQDAIGIGDNWNDIEMFEVCGVGIAMGNAELAVQELADEVTAPLDENGIANAFRRHGLV